MTSARGRLETLVLAAISLAAAIFVLDRWLVTGLDPLAYGRIWQLFINYPEFGFTRRALIGTLLHLTGLRALFPNEYHFAIFAQHLGIIALVAVTATYFLRSRTEHSLLFKAVVFLSPTFILQAAYTTGSLDVFVLTLVAANVLLVRNMVVFSLLLAVGVFIHELFLFTVPAQLLAFHMRRELDVFARPAEAARMLALPIATVVVSMLVIRIAGESQLPRARYEGMMETLIPHAAHKIDLWSGYFEVSSSVGDNSRSASYLLRHLAAKLGYIFIPVAYVAVLAATLVRQERAPIWKLALLVAVVAPIFVYLVATDFYRWVGLAANMAILLLITYVDQRNARVGAGWLWALMCFSLLAPFGGAAIENPFPAHKFLLNKVLRHGHASPDAALPRPHNQASLPQPTPAAGRLG